MNAGQNGGGEAGAPLPPVHIDVPESVKHVAASELGQMKERFEKLTTGAHAVADIFDVSCADATRDIAELHARLLEAYRSNMMASLEFAARLAAARTVPDAIELWTGFARKQFEAYAAQIKDFWSFGQKLMADTAKPAASGLSRSVDQATSS